MTIKQIVKYQNQKYQMMNDVMRLNTIHSGHML